MRVDTLDVASPIDSSSVTVTASRYHAIEVAGVRSTTIIDRDMIVQSGADDLADALLLSPGVFIKRYGGPGSLATLSLRGTAAGQTVVMLDGVPWRSSADGPFDLSRLPLGAVDRLVVTRGGEGALYGPNALGGAVDIASGMRNHLALATRAGSFGERGISLEGGRTFGNHGLSLQLGYGAADGDYPFTFVEFGEEQEVRRNNGTSEDLYGRIAWRSVSEGWQPGASVTLLQNRRGLPGSVTQGRREQRRASLEESEATGSLRLDGRIDRVLLRSALRLRRNRLDYRDPDVRTGGPDGLDLRYDREDVFLLGGATWLVDLGTAIAGRLEFDRAALEGDNLDPSVGRNVDRSRIGVALYGVRQFEETPFGPEVRFDVGLRADHFDDLGTHFSPSFGLVWRPTRLPLRLRFHASRSYRAPTFAEQYYLNLGNADLTVERGTSLTLGSTWLIDEALLVEGSLFSIDTRDRIVAIPRSPLVTTTLNIGRVLSRGAELGLRGTLLPGILDIAAAYTRMATIDETGSITDGHRIPYAPDEVGSLTLIYSSSILRATAGVTYTSHRHTLGYNTPESALPRYALFDVGLTREQPIGPLAVTITARLRNTLDVRYEVVQGYPMPGRSLLVALDLVLPEVLQ